MSKKKKERFDEEIVDETVEVNEVQESEEVDVQSQLEEKIKQLEEQHMRLAAEYDNYKRRTQKEKEKIYTDALVDTIASILPVADNLERATSLKAETEEGQKIQEGVDMITKQFMDILEKMGVSEMITSGECFDPNLHEAVMHIEDDNFGENVIVEEFSKGYLYREERVIRHSMVKVAN